MVVTCHCRWRLSFHLYSMMAAIIVVTLSLQFSSPRDFKTMGKPYPLIFMVYIWVIGFCLWAWIRVELSFNIIWVLGLLVFGLRFGLSLLCQLDLIYDLRFGLSMLFQNCHFNLIAFGFSFYFYGACILSGLWLFLLLLHLGFSWCFGIVLRMGETWK